MMKTFGVLFTMAWPLLFMVGVYAAVMGDGTVYGSIEVVTGLMEKINNE